MKVEIKIIVESENVINEGELKSDINWQFRDITGYEPEEIEIREI